MLQPNPVKRIKLAEIQRHRWYLTNLPDYLKQLSTQSTRTEQQIDMEIVNKLYEIDKRL